VDGSVAWQAGNDPPEGICRGWLSWALFFLAQFFRFGTPTMVLWSDAYRAGGPKKKVIHALPPFRTVLFAKTLCDFCTVLREQLDAPGSPASELRRS